MYGSILLFITAISKDEKKSWKKKLKNERLNFENPIFWCFPDFLQNFAVNDFLKSFAEWLTRFWFFSFLKIIFRHWIWNEIPDLEQNCCFKIVFCLLFRNGCLELVAIFFGTCCFEMYLLCFSLWECFLGGCRFENIFCRFSLWIFFGAYRFENDFLLLSLWKWFFALVAVKIIFGSSRFKKCLSLTSLKIIFCSFPFESYFGR